MKQTINLKMVLATLVFFSAIAILVSGSFTQASPLTHNPKQVLASLRRTGLPTLVTLLARLPEVTLMARAIFVISMSFHGSGFCI